MASLSERKDVALSRSFHPFAAIGLAAVGVMLAWLVVSKSLVAFLAGNAPQAALWLSPGDSQALLSLAERRRKSVSGAARAQVREWAETALANDPINARALRILGQVADAAGDEGGAARYMQAAARRSVQESAALHWLVRSRYHEKDYAAALRLADALLRTRSQALPRLLPILGRMAESAEAAPHLERLLAGNPPWRRAFLSALPRAVTDARTPLRLLLAVRGTPDAPTLADVGSYVSLLVRHKYYELAYYTWLQFLPRGQLGGAGFLFNGSFELDPSGLPFDWTMRGGKGVAIDIAQRPDDARRRALRVALGPGRVELGGVEQTLLLAPGGYRFQARYRGEIDGPRGLVWRVACVGGPPIGQSDMLIGKAPAWKETVLSFTVPAAGCRAQRLRLVLDARMPSEQLVSGSVWLDELHISRQE